MPDRQPEPKPGPEQGKGKDERPDGKDERPDAAERLRSALTRPQRSQLVVGVLLAVLGFAFVVQVRDYDREENYTGLRQDQLIEVLDGLTTLAERARREVERLEATQEDLQTESGAREAALAAAEERARNLSILAGLVPVRGPGLRVTVAETDGRVTVGSLLDLVQELRTAGAEAMEFNDSYRLAAQSSFQNAVGGILVDDNLLEPPYVLEVIGDPHVLEGALTFPTGPADTLEKLDGATVTIERLDTVEIESVREPVRPVEAEPLDGQ